MNKKDIEYKLEGYRAQARDRILESAKFLNEHNKDNLKAQFNRISDAQTAKVGEWIIGQAMAENMTETQLALTSHNREALLRLGKERGETRKFIQARLEEIAKEERLRLKGKA